MAKPVTTPEKRPAWCKICGKQLYYSGHPKFEDEVTVNVDRRSGTGPIFDSFYAHQRCAEGTVLDPKFKAAKRLPG